MLVNLADIAKSFGAQRVLDGVSLEVHAGRRVGLVGANGSGKTTLLRIIVGSEQPDSGRVTHARGIKIGYLEQEPALDEAETVYQAVLSAFAELHELEARLRLIEREMAEERGDRREALARQHGELLERFERGGGYEHESRTRAVLHGVGLGRAAEDQPVARLSGGERSRLALARLLLRDVDLLLLDEPTNHLDLSGVEWLEQFLVRYRGGVIVVSHDRLFLDRTVTSIVELEGGRMEGYPGNYSRYVEIRAARRLEQRRRFEEQQDFISREEAFIRRYGAGQRSREARGRRKRLNQLERLERPSAEQRVRMSFRADRLSGEVVLRAEDLACRYGDRTLFEGVRFDLYRGERMGVVGPNGCGKTSLLRMALGQTAPAAGRIALGQNLRVGYYDQLQAGLNPDRTVLDEVWELRRTMNENDVRDMLALFRFHGDDVMKRMGDCSGGERGRVALAKLMIESPNFLILDEPTHHLDIPSHEALEEALLDYDGTILVVSHDRFFLNRIVSRLLVFEPTRTRVIYGDWTSYEEARQAEEAAKAAPPTPPRAPSPPRKPAAMSKNRFAQLEARIIQLEEERARIEGELVKPEIYTDGDKVRRIMLRRREVEGELADLNAQWDAAAEAM